MTGKQKRYNDRLFNIRYALPEKIRQRVTRERIEILFDSLNRRQQTALVLRYGLAGGKSHTYREVAEILGNTPQAAERLIKRAKSRLYLLSKEKLLDN